LISCQLANKCASSSSHYSDTHNKFAYLFQSDINRAHEIYVALRCDTVSVTQSQMNSPLAAWLVLLATLGGATSLLPALEEQLQGN
jgi:hypothetical protein